MFKSKSAKIGSKRKGILGVFTKTISDLDNLEKETATRIKTQDDLIAKEQQEKDALETERKIISKTVGSMKKAIGFDEDVAPKAIKTEVK